MESEVIRTPHQRQQEALRRTEREILYWGARWWGKTDCWLAWLLYDIENPLLRALVLRETYDDLSDWLDRAMAMYEPFWARKAWNPVTIEFPSGAKIRLGYLKWQSYDKYKGHEYQRILIEEVTQIPWEEWYEKLLGSLRSTVDWLKPQILLTTNPDWVGRLWVKRRFVDVTDPWVPYVDDFDNSRIYIPAKVTDNPTIIEKDPAYIKYLEGIKDNQLRKAWLHGDWDAYDIKWGIYTSQLNQAKEEQRITRVWYNKNFPVDTVWDIWFSDYTTIIFFQQIGKEIRIIDTYYNEGEYMEHYVGELEKRKRELWYNYGTHYWPHDTKNSNLVWTPERRARELGLKFDIIKRTGDVWRDIDKARQVFAYCWFDRDKCKTLLEHLEIYRKQRDDKHQVFKSKPYHWPESHFSDAFRYLSCVVDLDAKRKHKVINVKQPW